MAKRSIVTIDRLRHLIDYNPETGEFTKRPKKIGSIVGKARHKFWMLYIEGVQYSAHRVAWFWMTGQWPPNSVVVDHINGDATDNRWANLRLASPSENQRNRTKVNNNNSSGLTGVYKKKKDDKYWFSSLGNKYLGRFSTKEEAHEAYRKAALEKFGEFAPDRLKK